jgi:hypothetical protein
MRWEFNPVKITRPTLSNIPLARDVGSEMPSQDTCNFTCGENTSETKDPEVAK